MSPLAIWQLWRVRRGDIFLPRHWNQFAFFSVALLIGTGVVELIAFLLLFLAREKHEQIRAPFAAA